MFVDSLIEKIEKLQAPCVVGLDPNIDLMPEDFLKEHNYSPSQDRTKKAEIILAYNKMVIDQVYDLVPALKPQSAYYERFGSEGIKALEQTLVYARSKGLLVILDVKRNDIGATSEAYAEAYLGNECGIEQEYDCMTVTPYLGDDSLEPFVKKCMENGKGIFVCVKTSNPGSNLFQNLALDGKKLYLRVADMVNKWAVESVGKYDLSGIGAVVGATYPEEAKELREYMPHAMFLVPGFGAQGGAAAAVKACFKDGLRGGIVNNSRAVMFPHLKTKSTAPIAEQVREATEKFVKDIRAILGQ